MNALKKLKQIVLVDEEKCVNCHACITACPIKFCNDGSGDHVSINDDMCIGCGQCIDACTHDARVGVDDADDFFEDLRQGKKIVAIAAPSVASNFPDKYLNLNGWLEILGVSDVFDVSFGAELSIKSYMSYMQEENPPCAISPACPAVVNYIQLYHKELLPFIIPFDSPMRHTIKMIKEFYPKHANSNVAVISPCLAKKREFEDLGVKVYNITYKSLNNFISQNNIDLSLYDKKIYSNPSPERAVMFSSPGGCIAAAERVMPGVTNLSRKIEGPGILYPYLTQLSEVIRKKLNPTLVDCLNCELGCNGGTGTDRKYDSRDELEYFIRERKKELEAYYKKEKTSETETMDHHIDTILSDFWKPELYKHEYVSLEENNTIEEPDFSEIANIYAEMHKYTESDLYNCSSCGYGHCQDMAKAIFNGLNKSENCHYFQKTEIDHHNEQLKEANEFLKKEQMRADIANNAKSKFLAHMSHELRTPMTCVMGYSQMLIESKNMDPESYNKYTSSIFKSAEHMSDLISDILDFSKIEAGALLLEQKEIDIKTLISEVGDVFLPSIKGKDVEIRYEIDDNIPEKVVGDYVRIKQIFLNLIGNAVKFTTEGSVTITASQHESYDDNMIFNFSVKDTGISIPEDKKEEIFEAFTQVDTSVTREYGGTGLGLSITRALIKMMGGDIHVTSKEGEGSCFSFNLNLKIVGGVSLIDNEKEEIINVRKGAKVLIAEDNLTLQEYLCELLFSYGLEVVTADDGQAAVKKAITGKYDLMLMDINMPKLDGISATKQIKDQILYDLPILGLSAVTTPDVIEKAMEAGMDEFLTKPISPQKFIKTLNEYLPVNKSTFFDDFK